MSRMQRAIFGSLLATLVGFAAPALAGPAGLALAKPDVATNTTLVGHHGFGGGGFGGFSHHSFGGGGFGHHSFGGGGFGRHSFGSFNNHYAGNFGRHWGGYGHHRHWRGYGYPYIGYYGGYYPYYDDSYYDDDYADEVCYYSRKYRRRICTDD